MDSGAQLIYDTKRLMITRYPRFASEISNANIEYRTNLKYRTAGTDGKNVYFDPEYFASLTEDERLFLIAHELMHIKFAHTFRLIDKNGNKRDFDTWNEATDAIINANLERDGFKIKEGYVNRPEALEYSAEEFYEILLKEKEEQKQKNQNGSSSNSSDNNSGEPVENSDSTHSGDDHSLWEEAFEKSMEEQRATNPNYQDFKPNDIDERKEFSENRQERIQRARENLEKQKEELLKRTENKQSSQKINLGNVGSANNSISWETLVRREVEKNETIWTQRRSIIENNYAYRLEEFEEDEEAITEIMIDVSGSVDIDLVKSFLRLIKPLVRHTKLKVGCFNAQFWGMVDIKSDKDIDNFIIPEEARSSTYAYTEDWDLAVRSFTKKKEVNKFVFTDGDPCPGTMPKHDLKGENVIWFVYGNKNFRPCCGKVINLTQQQIKNSDASYNQIVGRIK